MTVPHGLPWHPGLTCGVLTPRGLTGPGRARAVSVPGLVAGQVCVWDTDVGQKAADQR